eukprot:2370-Heterococcus_DN1.PRE.2
MHVHMTRHRTVLICLIALQTAWCFVPAVNPSCCSVMAPGVQRSQTSLLASRAQQHRAESMYLAMAYAEPEITGLPMGIYITPEFPLIEKPGPHIRVSQNYGHINGGRWFIMTIEDNPQIIGAPGAIRFDDVVRVRDFILLNKETLLKYWEHDESVDGFEIMFNLTKVEAINVEADDPVSVMLGMLQGNPLGQQYFKLLMLQQDTNTTLLTAQIQLSKKEAEVLKGELLAANGALYRLQGLLHPRGMIELCEKKAFNNLHASTPPDLSRTEVWQSILLTGNVRYGIRRDEQLATALQDAVQLDEQLLPKFMTELYDEVSTTVHTHRLSLRDRVTILKEQLSSAQVAAITVMCDYNTVLYEL